VSRVAPRASGGPKSGERPDDLTCRELVELVTEYLEGTLSPPELSRFEDHLAVCAGCATHLRQMQETLRTAGRLSDRALSGEARESLLCAFRDWKRTPSRPT
jgi:anti-sigma factor RsiW